MCRIIFSSSAWICSFWSFITESANDAITAFIFYSRYRFSYSRFFYSSSCNRAYYSCAFMSCVND
jgi:hypothetical protein